MQEIDFYQKFQAVLVQQDIPNSILTQTVTHLVAHYGKYLHRITVNPTQVSEVAGLVPADQISLGTVVGYPLGNLPKEVKAMQIKAAKQSGADHVDIVLPIEYLLDQQPQKAETDVLSLTATCQELHLSTAWVANLAFLERAQKKQAVDMTALAGTALVTNSGFNNQTTPQDLLDLRRHNASLPITACGGIESAEGAAAMLDAGADWVASHTPTTLLAGLETLLSAAE